MTNEAIRSIHDPEEQHAEQLAKLRDFLRGTDISVGYRTCDEEWYMAFRYSNQRDLVFETIDKLEAYVREDLAAFILEDAHQILFKIDSLAQMVEPSSEVDAFELCSIISILAQQGLRAFDVVDQVSA